VTQDADIEEILRQVQVDSLRRLAKRLRNELDRGEERSGRLAQSGH
jgi:hypothetical protein